MPNIFQKRVGSYIQKNIETADFLSKKVSNIKLEETPYEDYFNEDYNKNSIFKNIESSDYIFSSNKFHRENFSDLKKSLSEKATSTYSIEDTINKIYKSFFNVMESVDLKYSNKNGTKGKSVSKVLQEISENAEPIDEIDKIMLGMFENCLVSSSEIISPGDRIVKLEYENIWTKSSYDSDSTEEVNKEYAIVIEETESSENEYKKYRCKYTPRKRQPVCWAKKPKQSFSLNK